MWKGVIQLGGDELPVKLYAAVAESGVHFHLLHAPDEVRVEQRIVRPDDVATPLPPDAIRKGYALDAGKFVLLTKAELARLRPKASRDIALDACVPLSSIAPEWFERPYYLGPDGDEGGYAALAEALERKRQQAIVRWVMRGKRYVGALRPRGERLILITLRDREEVIAAPRLPQATRREASAQELALAEQLVATLEGEFDPTQFKSEYRERVLKLIGQKARGRHIRLVRPTTRKQGGSLERMLAASVKRTGAGSQRKAAHHHPHKEKRSA